MSDGYPESACCPWNMQAGDGKSDRDEAVTLFGSWLTKLMTVEP